jgi:hypothetical protein
MTITQDAVTQKLTFTQSAGTFSMIELQILGDVLVDVPFGQYVMREFDETTTNHNYWPNFRNAATFDLALYAEGTEQLLELNGLPVHHY